MNALAWLLSLASELYETARYRRRERRCQHWMVQQADGPVCELCGRTWVWRRRPI